MRKPNRISTDSHRRQALRRIAAAVLVCTAYPELAVAAVDFSAAVSHQGYFFVGTPGGAYTVSVTNIGDSDSSSPVSVSQSLPAGMTYASASADWDCSASTGAAVSCTYSGGVVAGDAAPELGITVSVTESASATNSLGAVTVVSGEDANAANNITAPHAVSVKARPVLGLEIAKAVDSPTPAASTPITYTITLRNESAVDLTNIQVDELLPDSSRVTYTPGDASWYPPAPSSSYDDNAHVWTIQSLAAGQEAILTLPVTVAAAAPADPFANTVEITAGPEAQINSLARSAGANVAVGGVELAITKVVDVNTPDLNDTVVYTLEVSNHGSTDATGVTVSDTLPAGLTYDAVTGTYTQRDIGLPSVSGSTLEWTGLNIDSGETLRIDLPATVTGGNRTVLTNNAEVLSDTANDQFDPDTSNNTDSAAIAVGGADVEIITELSNEVPAENENFEYRIYAKNHGSNAVGQVWLDVSLPSSGASYGIDGGTTNGSSQEWPIQTSLPAGGAPVLLSTFPLTVSGSNGDILEFSSTITGAQVSENGQWVTLPDPDRANNTQTVTAAVGGVDLSSQVSPLETAPAAGGSVTYRISVTNESAARQATGVSMKFYLPAGLSYQSTGSSIEYDGSTSLLTIADPVLAGETMTFDVVADVAGDLTAGTVITARTTALTADQVDPDHSNDSDSATIVVGGADLRLTLSVPNGPYYPGSSVTYTLTLQNLSTRATTGSSVRDFLPRGLTYSSASDESAYSASTGIWTVPALAAAGNPGDSATLDIVAVIDSGTAGRTITNVATVASTSPKDPVTDNDSGQATITVQAIPLVDVSLTMNTLNAQSSPITTVAEQATLRYSLSIANAGPDTVHDVQVSDTLPAGLTYASSSHGTYDSGTRVWSYTAPMIAAGGSLTVTIDTTVNPGIVSPGAGTTLSNTAAITGINAVEQDTTPGNETAVLAITVTAPTSVIPLRLRGSSLDRNCNVYDFTMDAQGAANATVNDACIAGLAAGTGLTLATHGGTTRQVDLTSLTVDAAGDMVAGLGIDIVRTGDCSGDVVDLSAYVFVAGETCTASTSLAAHTAVQVAAGQSVTFVAPVIRLQPGFSAAAGSTFVARTQ